MTKTMNRQVLLVSRPEGIADAANFRIVESCSARMQGFVIFDPSEHQAPARTD